ncbi:hypothetical protein [Fructilactobacillus carniphilus]|uniref:Uncharacterized protein n=1 Tax=Fructilactobacillus carniphilus TaxID=2940297 RepID=A0ABY5BV61_9LACO|nr:hypothetical protein [Fructilactobacillus carniphilus]USS90382.1 hypothetical protein M3M37_05945 [Fructilactobacillus carniphilus]
MPKTESRVTKKVDEKIKEIATKTTDQETIDAINDAYTGNTVKIGNIDDFDKWMNNV